MLVRAKIIISGRVQGVLFRDGLREQAVLRGLNGYARNLPTGEVEAIVEGEKDQVDLLIGWARVGPPHAKVEKLDLEWEDGTAEYSGFRIL